jgi:hypothetical protein
MGTTLSIISPGVSGRKWKNIVKRKPLSIEIRAALAETLQ